MEGGIQLLSQDDGAGGEPERQHHAHQDETHASSHRLSSGDGRIEDPKLLALLALLHALGDLGLPIALQQRLVELSGALVIPRKLLELLLSPRDVVDPCLVGGDRRAKMLFLSLEDPGLRVDLAQRLLQPAGVWRRRLGLRRFALGFSLVQLLLEGGDLCPEHDDIRILFAELGPEFPHLLLEPDQSRLGFFWSATQGAGVRLLAGQRGSSLHGTRLVIAIEAKL